VASFLKVKLWTLKSFTTTLEQHDQNLLV